MSRCHISAVKDRDILKRNFDFQNLTFFDQTIPELRSNVKMSVTIKVFVRNDPVNMCHRQGCGVVVNTGVGVGRSRSFWLESELESVKFGRLRLRPGVAS